MRLIDADALKEELELKLFKMSIVSMRSVLEVINAAPTIKAEPVKRGRWMDCGDKFVQCTECGWIFGALPTIDSFKENNLFCRRCGALMVED